MYLCAGKFLIYGSGWKKMVNIHYGFPGVNVEKTMKKIDYRNQALKILPWVCGKCGRDFSGKKLRELTVHHKDHNHDNNPADGSNWELLCIYCHDNEHSRHLDAQWLATEDPDRREGPTTTHNPFAQLGHLLDNKRKKKKGGQAE